MEINNFHISLNCCVSVVLGAPSKGDIDRVTEIAHCVEKSATGEWNPQVLRYHEKSTKTHHFWLVVSIMVFMFHDIWDNPSHWLSYFSRWLKPPTRFYRVWNSTCLKGNMFVVSMVSCECSLKQVPIGDRPLRCQRKLSWWRFTAGGDWKTFWDFLPDKVKGGAKHGKMRKCWWNNKDKAPKSFSSTSFLLGYRSSTSQLCTC